MATSADDWWDSLSQDRKEQIKGWLDRTPGMVYSHGQLTLLAEKEEPNDASLDDV